MSKPLLHIENNFLIRITELHFVLVRLLRHCNKDTHNPPQKQLIYPPFFFSATGLMCSSRNSFCFFQKKIFVYIFVFIYARRRWRCTGIGTPTHTLGGTLDLTSIVGKAHSAPSHHATRAFTHPHSTARIRSHERSRKAMRTLVPTGVKARSFPHLQASKQPPSGWFDEQPK